MVSSGFFNIYTLYTQLAYVCSQLNVLCTAKRVKYFLSGRSEPIKGRAVFIFATLQER